MLLLLQAAAGPYLAPAAKPRVGVPCPPPDSSGDVVVCAREQESFRLRRLPGDPDRPTLPKAELHLGNARLAAEAEQATLAGGVQSQRLMLRLKLPIDAGAKRAAR